MSIAMSSIPNLMGRREYMSKPAARKLAYKSVLCVEVVREQHLTSVVFVNQELHFLNPLGVTWHVHCSVELFTQRSSHSSFWPDLV